MRTTHQEPRTGVAAASARPAAGSCPRPYSAEPAVAPVEFAWSFPVVNVAGRLTAGRVVVTATGLIVVRAPDGGWFAVDPGDQFAELCAALRQARQLALTTQERSRRAPRHWRE